MNLISTPIVLLALLMSFSGACSESSAREKTDSKAHTVDPSQAESVARASVTALEHQDAKGLLSLMSDRSQKNWSVRPERFARKHFKADRVRAAQAWDGSLEVRPREGGMYATAAFGGEPGSKFIYVVKLKKLHGKWLFKRFEQFLRSDWSNAGSESISGVDLEDPASVARAALKAVRENNAKLVIQLVPPGDRQVYRRMTGMAKNLSMLFRSAGNYDTGTPIEVRVEGNRAMARYGKTSNGDASIVELRREQGHWYLGSIWNISWKLWEEFGKPQ